MGSYFNHLYSYHTQSVPKIPTSSLTEKCDVRLEYRFSAIPIRIPANFFVEIDKLNLKFIWKEVPKTLLKKKRIGLTLPDFKTCNKATVTKVV